MQFPITIGLHRSLFLKVAFAVVLAFVIAVLLIPPWLPELKAALLAGVAFPGILVWRRLSPTVDTLRLLDDGRLECRLAGTDVFLEAELRPGATVHPWLTAVPLRVADRKLVLVVLIDSADSDDFRRLRIWLRWRAEFSVVKSAA